MAHSKERVASVMVKMLPLQGVPIPALSRQEGISEATLYKWRGEARSCAAGPERPMDGPKRRTRTHDQRPGSPTTLSLIEEARSAGARLSAACAELGLSARTVQRWAGPDGSAREDARPTAARPAPTNRRSDAERDRIVAPCSAPEFASAPPGQIVPRLADRSEYIGSQSTMYRVLRERGQAGRRGRAKTPRKSRPPTTHRAAGPCHVWSRGITWLPGPALGVFFHLCLILDIWSRKITGWGVHDRENGELAAQVIWPAATSDDRPTMKPGATTALTDTAGEELRVRPNLLFWK